LAVLPDHPDCAGLRINRNSREGSPASGVGNVLLAGPFASSSVPAGYSGLAFQPANIDVAAYRVQFGLGPDRAGEIVAGDVFGGGPASIRAAHPVIYNRRTTLIEDPIEDMRQARLVNDDVRLGRPIA